MDLSGIAWAANVSILFTEVAYLDRFEEARRAGFEVVETWWPFATPTPTEDEVSLWLAAVAAAGQQVDAINAYAGDMPAGERGVACLAGRHQELWASLPTLSRMAAETGCAKFNVLYGQSTAPDHAVIAGQAYRRVAAELADLGTVLIEPLASGLNGDYPLHTPADIEAFVDDQLAEVSNVGLLLDTFHLAMNDVDPVAAWNSTVPVRHVQIADPPGRGEPGSGTLDWGRFFDSVRGSGYRGTVACEYRPTTTTAESLAWLQSS